MIAPNVHHPLQTAEVRVANRLRQLRSDKALTLKELASTAGISQAYLSRVENHKAALPISGLERLARALGVSMGVFFEEDDRALPITVCRAGKGSKGRLRGARGLVYEMLASQKAGKLMEPLLIDIASAARELSLRSHPGEELNFVLEGEFLLLYGKDEIRLREGDAAYYDAAVPHAARRIADRPCRILAVVASRDYVFHGDLTQLLEGGTS